MEGKSSDSIRRAAAGQAPRQPFAPGSGPPPEPRIQLMTAAWTVCAVSTPPCGAHSTPAPPLKCRHVNQGAHNRNVRIRGCANRPNSSVDHSADGTIQ
ncbi:hypothetical protein [Lysobacter gummosus]|uniref:hypothetical protein n=1 Tax=Lysobacter gummosus TaxID=262324 RepID=UPI0036329761